MAEKAAASKTAAARKTAASKAKNDEADAAAADAANDDADAGADGADGADQPTGGDADTPSTDVDLGYSLPTGEGREHSVPGGPSEAGAGAAEHHAPVAASPLDAPGDRRPPVQPQRHLSTSPVSAAAGQRSLPGQGSMGLCDDQGNDLDPDSLFDDSNQAATYVVTKQRIYQRVLVQNARTSTTQLLFPAGARIPRDKADAFVHAAKADAEQPLTEAAGRAERMKGDGTAAAAAVN